MEYRFPHFKRQLLKEDAHFQHGPAPDEVMPDFDLATIAGNRIRKEDFRGHPWLLIFSSIT